MLRALQFVKQIGADVPGADDGATNFLHRPSPEVGFGNLDWQATQFTAAQTKRMDTLPMFWKRTRIASPAAPGIASVAPALRMKVPAGAFSPRLRSQKRNTAIH